jgi:predicted dehydrogenase
MSSLPSEISSHAPVRLAVVGLNFGEYMVNLMHAGIPGLDLRLLCDQQVEKARRLAEKCSVRATGSLDEVLADSEIEAIALFTGPKGRSALVEKILSAGKHLLTTKPFELDLSSAERALATAATSGLVLHLNSPGPTPAADLDTIRTWETERKLGRVVGLRAETWASYREQPNGTWYDDPDSCPAAPITRLGIYFLNDFLPLLGRATRLHVVQSRLFTERPTADNAQITAEFENGSLANVFASFCINDGEPYRDDVTLNYENGTIRRRVIRTPEGGMNTDHVELELTLPGKPVERLQLPPGAYAGWYQWEAFARAIRGDSRVPRVAAEATLNGVCLLDAVRRSVASGHPVSV